MRVSPAAPRTQAPRPAHLPEPGLGGNGRGLAGPSTAATNQKLKKKKKKKADYTAPKAAPSRQQRLGAGGDRVRAPPREGGGGGGGAGAVSELRGLGRGGAPRRGASSCTHLPRSSAAPTEAARVRPGDFPAPSDGGSRGVNGAAGAPLQPPAARRRRSGARGAPSAGAFSADGGAGAPQRRQLPRRRLGLPAVAAGGSDRGRAPRGLRGGAAVGGRGGVAPPGWLEGGRSAGPVGTAGRADRAGAGHQQ